MIKVMIVDDQRLFRESIKRIIELGPEISVEACAGNGQEALAAAAETKPDLILMDLKMPICNGAEGTRLIKEAFPAIKIIILTTFEDDENISHVIENGADGYVNKEVTPEELIRIVKSTSGDYCIVSKKTYEYMAKQVTTINKTDGLAELLNENELRILQLIADGKSNKEIAGSIFLSEGRVKNIVSEMLAKLNLKDRYQMISFAYKNNLLG